jgi:hypothetical protein
MDTILALRGVLSKEQIIETSQDELPEMEDAMSALGGISSMVIESDPDSDLEKEKPTPPRKKWELDSDEEEDNIRDLVTVELHDNFSQQVLSKTGAPVEMKLNANKTLRSVKAKLFQRTSTLSFADYQKVAHRDKDKMRTTLLYLPSGKRLGDSVGLFELKQPIVLYTRSPVESGIEEGSGSSVIEKVWKTFKPTEQEDDRLNEYVLGFVPSLHKYYKATGRKQKEQLLEAGLEVPEQRGQFLQLLFWQKMKEKRNLLYRPATAVDVEERIVKSSIFPTTRVSYTEMRNYVSQIIIPSMVHDGVTEKKKFDDPVVSDSDVDWLVDKTDEIFDKYKELEKV